MREPLSEEEVKRIARETAHETVKRVFELLSIVALSVVGISLLPVLVIMSVNSFAPAFGRTGSPLLGFLFAVTFGVVAAILIRSWTSIRR